MPILLWIGLWAIVIGSLTGCASSEDRYWADLSMVTGQIIDGK